jgi:predicted O-methyltransferase YrrM
VNEQIRRAIDTCREFIDRRDDALALPREAAHFVYALVLSRGARNCVEIGTSYGYSGLWIAAAANMGGGKLITIDRAPHKHEAARRFFAEAGLADAVELHLGEALDVLSTIRGPIDFVLNDADKENVVNYFDLLADQLTPGGVFVTDNLMTHPQIATTLLPRIKGDDRFFTTTVPIGNGMELTVRLR